MDEPFPPTIEFTLIGGVRKEWGFVLLHRVSWFSEYPVLNNPYSLSICAFIKFPCIYGSVLSIFISMAYLAVLASVSLVPGNKS